MRLVLLTASKSDKSPLVIRVRTQTFRWFGVQRYQEIAKSCGRAPRAHLRSMRTEGQGGIPLRSCIAPAVLLWLACCKAALAIKPTVKYVETPEDFQAAFTKNARDGPTHIVILQHLDLRVRSHTPGHAWPGLMTRMTRSLHVSAVGTCMQAGMLWNVAS